MSFTARSADISSSDLTEFADFTSISADFTIQNRDRNIKDEHQWVGLFQRNIEYAEYGIVPENDVSCGFPLEPLGPTSNGVCFDPDSTARTSYWILVLLPSGNLTWLWKVAIYSRFSH